MVVKKLKVKERKIFNIKNYRNNIFTIIDKTEQEKETRKKFKTQIKSERKDYIKGK